MEDWYGFVPYFSPVVCQLLCLVVQRVLTVRLKAKSFEEAAHVLFIFVVDIVGTATFAAGSGKPVWFWGALLLRMCRLVWGHTGHLSSWSW
jgi:hypothetical protein